MTLVTISEVKTGEGITGSTHDTVLTALVSAVTALFENVCRRTFASTVYTDVEYDGTGTDKLILANPPITDISSIKIASNRNFGAATALASSRYVFDDAGVVTLVPASGATSIILGGDGGIFPKGHRVVQISYTGGFATIPADLKQAAILMCSTWMNRRRRGGVLSTTVGSETVTFQQREIPIEVMAILSRYRLYPLLCGRSGD